MERAQKGDKIWMVVEDDPSLRMMLSTMIMFWERTPLAFADGHEAMAWLDEVENRHMASSSLPQLALLDIRMPGPQGHEIAGRMRKIPEMAATPLVMMTAYRFDPEERNDIVRIAQPDKFISKPLPGVDELKNLLEALIDDSQPRIAMEMSGR